MTETTKHYPETSSSPNFPKIEKNIQKFWAENKIFQKSVDALPAEGEQFSFFDGPPFANGLPHYGHMLTSCVKDLYARYHTMKGERTERVFGWDCHGLPAEMEAEKQLDIQGQIAIQEYGIGKFNEVCKTSVMKYTDEWEDYINRLGRWVDFDNGYKTMDKNYMESVMWAFAELHRKGLVYEGHKVMPYSWACETPLSNFETRMDNAYREKISKAATVAFELNDGRKILAWTTTPWTLPSNLALSIGKDVQYVEVEANGSTYIIGKNAVAKYAGELDFNEESELKEISFDGLLGKKYKPLFPYFANDERGGENAFTIIEGDFVSDSDGTGIVHLAPGFGEDDQRVCEAVGICKPENGGIICPVDEAGKFTKEIFDIEFDLKTNTCHPALVAGLNPDKEEITPQQVRGDTKRDKTDLIILSLKGLNVMKDKNKSSNEPYNENQLNKYGLANLRIVENLKSRGLLIKQEDYVHNYPHCWRTDTPLIYKAVPSWYVKVTAFKDRMVELNKDINWIPPHIRDGQFGKWLENAHDWAISRNRFWGAPIPVWKTKSGKMKVFGSIAEMEEFFGVEVNDLHRPFIDALKAKDPETGEEYTRVSEVLDCWFESGSMPFAELHYPFENKDKFEKRFPADFIVEYVAQTRGWFYTLMVLSTSLFDSVPFKNCICHGVILGEPLKNPQTGKMEKQKLSKRLKNYADPVEVFDTLGADAIRWMMIASPVMNGGELTVSRDASDIREVVRLTLKPIWNAYHFFCLYANSDKAKAELSFNSENLMDRYILAKLKEAVEVIDKSLTNYDTPTACVSVDGFFEAMNNWYIRRSRERFWRSTDCASDADKQSAYNTLYTCLVTLSQAAAPLLPYIFEEIYKNLTGKESVHLERFPDISQIDSDASLASQMDKVREICNAGLSVRNQENIRIRQPLADIQIFGQQGVNEISKFSDIICEELNIKSASFSENLGDKASLNLKINFPILGKRLPEKMKQIIPASKQGKWSQNENGEIEILGEVLTNEECSLTLEPKDPKGAAALPSNDALVILNLEISDELREEGFARDVVRLIQQARKDAELDITNRINISLSVEGALESAIKSNASYIAEQVLADIVNFDGDKLSAFLGDFEIEGNKIGISFEKSSTTKVA